MFNICYIEVENKLLAKKIIADEGFPIELEEDGKLVKLTTWIKDYNPNEFLDLFDEKRTRGTKVESLPIPEGDYAGHLSLIETIENILKTNYSYLYQSREYKSSFCFGEKNELSKM